MSDASHYVIRGGLEGRERLRLMSRVLHPTTSSLFDRVGLADGCCCLDVGCGGGDVTIEMAKRAGPTGSAVGVDIDETKLGIAGAEATRAGIGNIEFRCSDIRVNPIGRAFDVVYARFLLTHLSDPAAVVRTFFEHLNPGGTLVVEDIDFGGYFTHPECPAFQRYVDWYCATVVRRGGDPNIGRRLPSLLKQAGFDGVGVTAVQHVATEGDAKLISPLTMENIAGAVLADGLATPQQIDDTVRELFAFAADPETVAGTPRIVQSWGRRPVA